MPKGGSPQSTWPATAEGQAPADSHLGARLRGHKPCSPRPRQGPGHHSPRPPVAPVSRKEGSLKSGGFGRHSCRLGGNSEREQQSLGLSRAGTLPDPASLGDLQPSTHLSPSPANLAKFSLWCGMRGPTPQHSRRPSDAQSRFTPTLRAGSPRAAAASAWLCRRG